MEETKIKDKIVGIIFALLIIIFIAYGIWSVWKGTSDTNNISITHRSIQTAWLESEDVVIGSNTEENIVDWWEDQAIEETAQSWNLTE